MTQIHKIIERLKTDGQKFAIDLNQPASDTDIQKFETETNIRLPSELREFYKECNGFDAGNDFLFRVIPLYDIVGERDPLTQNRYPLAEYMIYSDTWIVEVRGEEYVIVNSNHGTEQELILCDSIVTFLNRYLDGDGAATENGLYKWFDEIKLANNDFTKKDI